ncbi:exo-alpha-sialidase, partial [Trypanosoma cruzi]
YNGRSIHPIYILLKLLQGTSTRGSRGRPLSLISVPTTGGHIPFLPEKVQRIVLALRFYPRQFRRAVMYFYLWEVTILFVMLLGGVGMAMAGIFICSWVRPRSPRTPSRVN